MYNHLYKQILEFIEFNKNLLYYLKLKGIHIPIKYKSLEEVGLIIELHLIRNKGINKKELQKELL